MGTSEGLTTDLEAVTVAGRPRLFFIGDFSASRLGNLTVAEELIPLLEAEGWSCLRSGSSQRPTAKLVGMLARAWTRRASYDLASIDVFSGRAFWWADLTSRLVHRLSKKIVLVLHGGALPDLARRHPSRMQRLLDRADRVVAPSTYLARELRSHQSSIQVIPNGLAVARYAFHPHPFHGRDQSGPRLVWLRTFRDLYNPAMAIRALGDIRAEHPRAHLTMIGRDSGDGSLATTRAAVATAGLEDAVSFENAVAKERVPETLASHDVFLNTSRIDNAPVSVIEALACGLPVVSTEVGGLRDLLRHEATGLLVPADDAREMAAAVNRLCDDPRLAGRLATSGRELAETFDWSRVVELWQDTYQQTFELP